MSIIINRTAVENALLSKHTINSLLPIVDSNNAEHIKDIRGNQLRILKRYPATVDILANLINQVHDAGLAGKLFHKIDHFMWRINVSEETWNAQFDHFANRTIRQSIKRQVEFDMKNAQAIMYGRTRNGIRYYDDSQPFRVTHKIRLENGTAFRSIDMHNDVFGPLITMECTQNGGEGFVEIPAELYALSTHTDIYTLKSHNPIYRVNIFALSKNTHKKGKIEVPRDRFLKEVVPEYLDENGNLKIKEARLHADMIGGINAVEQQTSGLILSNFYTGNARNNVTSLYFRKE